MTPALPNRTRGHEAAAERKSWLLCHLDSIAALAEIQRNDALMLVATDDDALRHARCEARAGRRHAVEAVALHQRAKARCRAYRFTTTRSNGGRS
jgi:hypothetical protein